MSTGLWVVLIGLIVTFIGWRMAGTMLGAGIAGFGLAHILLGMLDALFGRVRPADPNQVRTEKGP